jgi:hypothetical protein
MLKDMFRKNGLYYKLIKRNDKVGFYETYVYGKLCGFEVARIYNEVLVSDDDFGLEGSKCFFAGEPKRARMYFEKLTKKLT